MLGLLNIFLPCVTLQVLFVCTANVVENIPSPLLDRMEVIAIAGYITDEKMHIARDYLEKSTREACGIKPEEVFYLSLTLLTCIYVLSLKIMEQQTLDVCVTYK